MAAKYDGFAPLEVAAMDQAFRLMQRASSKAKTALLGGDLTAYRKWFDATGTAHLMKVSSIVNEIDQAIASGRSRLRSWIGPASTSTPTTCVRTCSS